ncbi:MAG: YHS domain-containing protein [Phycisphaerales bacterium]|nr:YHS domain-containing protein [Phycisphaerales bacterium]
MKHRHAFATIAVSIFALALGITGCKKEEPAEAKAPTPEETAKITANLALADLHDGTTDRVVSECLMCGLRMKGSAEHTSKYQGVELHMCSAGCKKHFDADPATAILALDTSSE